MLDKTTQNKSKLFPFWICQYCSKRKTTLTLALMPCLKKMRVMDSEMYEKKG